MSNKAIELLEQRRENLEGYILECAQTVEDAKETIKRQTEYHQKYIKELADIHHALKTLSPVKVDKIKVVEKAKSAPIKIDSLKPGPKKHEGQVSKKTQYMRDRRARQRAEKQAEKQISKENK